MKEEGFAAMVKEYLKSWMISFKNLSYDVSRLFLSQTSSYSLLLSALTCLVLLSTTFSGANTTKNLFFIDVSKLYLLHNLRNKSDRILLALSQISPNPLFNLISNPSTIISCKHINAMMQLNRLLEGCDN